LPYQVQLDLTVWFSVDSRIQNQSTEELYNTGEGNKLFQVQKCT